MTAVALFRMFVVDIPLAPNYFSPLIQICLGLFIGSKVTREKVIYLKKLAKPALIIVSWVMLTAFALGALLFKITEFNLITAILSSTLGGLPEMTVIALETDADATVVVVIKTIRLVLTLILFPIIFEKWLIKGSAVQTIPHTKQVYQKEGLFKRTLSVLRECQKHFQKIQAVSSPDLTKTTRAIIIWVLSFGIATAGGLLFRYINVPAGAMVGGMFFIVIASMLGFKVKTVPVNLFVLLQIGLGIVLADTITVETFSMFTSTTFLLAVLVNIFIVFLTFFLIIYLVREVTDWDLQTCFLAAAPAGLTIMTALALKYNKDVFNISMLHLCRLIVIKAALPFILMRMM